MEELDYMNRALRLARKGQGTTSPNPMVGAVLVRDGEIIAEDYHRRPGEPHAEALVLEQAGERARGATLFVTLEPCCHTEKRTPPCARAIIEAGVKRVVAAMEDPNPRVSGRGIEGLRAAGIEAEAGLLRYKAQKLNQAYARYITTGRAFLTMKVAMTLDGKIATPEGRSQWITGPAARRYVHRMRSRADAVLTGVGTVSADDPRFTVREVKGRDPVRVVIDPDLRIESRAQIISTPPRTIIVTRRGRGEKADMLAAKGVEFIHYEERLSMEWLLRQLAAQGLISIMLEGGSAINGHAVAERVVDAVAVFIAPKLIGGRGSYPAVGGEEFLPLDEALVIRDRSVRNIGGDILIEGTVDRGK